MAQVLGRQKQQPQCTPSGVRLSVTLLNPRRRSASSRGDKSSPPRREDRGDAHLILSVEAWVGIRWLGERFERFDLSTELRP